MNANDLPASARLAVLIEAGRAANPDLKHGRAHLLNDDGEACALGFACLAAGATRETIRLRPYCIEDILGMPMLPRRGNLLWRIAMFNDREGSTIDGVVHALREGELAKVPA